MTHFPLFLDLKDKNIIIFGGGDFALQRVRKLLPFQPVISVISPTICNEIKEYSEVNCIERDFSSADLETQPAFVIIAEDEEKTEKIYKECRARNIHVNAVDMPKYCDIIFPSVISSEHLCIGISSGGISPTATVEFKEKFEEMIPTEIDSILEWMPHAKNFIKKNAAKEKQKGLLREVFRQAVNKNGILSDEVILTIINAESKN